MHFNDKSEVFQKREPLFPVSLICWKRLLMKTTLMHSEYSLLMNWVPPRFGNEQDSVRKENIRSVHFPVGEEESTLLLFVV
jgi:hypothetical protein